MLASDQLGSYEDTFILLFPLSIYIWVWIHAGTRTNTPYLPLVLLHKRAPGRNIGSLQCSTDPTLRRHTEQGSIQCCTNIPLAHSGHVTADWSPLCKKTAIEVSIWYRSDVALATAFFQSWGTRLVSTVRAPTATHRTPGTFSLCAALLYPLLSKGSSRASMRGTQEKTDLDCSTKLLLYMPNYKVLATRRPHHTFLYF